MKKLFGETKMTWRRVILFAVPAGVVTGLINQVPILYDTSFRDIAVCYEWWIFFATIIAVNCQKPLEAGLKVFVFFLISQPVVFLVETLFVGTGVWQYYRFWLMVTLLTFPGGMAANLVRRKDWLGGLMLCVALAMLGGELTGHAFSAWMHFPRHLLSALFCLALIVVFIMKLMDRKTIRAVGAVVAALTCAVTAVLALRGESSYEMVLPESGAWTASVTDAGGCRVEVGEDQFTYYYNPYLAPKENTILLTDASGKQAAYRVTQSRSGAVDLQMVTETEAE